MKIEMDKCVAICLLLMLEYGSGFEFDEGASCDSQLPTPAGGHSITLAQASGNSTYKLSVNAPKYRRGRVLKVKLDGGEFNGFLLQARTFTDAHSGNSMIIGTFVDVPSKLKTLDCGQGATFSVSNTIYMYNSSYTKNSIEVSWKAPMDDVGSIEFVASVIFGSNYWKPVKSTPLLFSEFPPSLVSCGVSQSCYRYSKIPASETSVEYIVVTNVVETDVIFTMGGKVLGDTGYIGIGFTNNSMDYVDMCVCVKTGPKAVIANNYIKNSNGSPKKGEEELEAAETDVDGDFIWCRFRRPLKIISGKAADLSFGMTQIFLWGPVEGSDNIPVYPPSSELIKISEPWNHTISKNVVHYIGGSSNLVGLSWTLLIAALLATLVELCRI